MSKHLDQLVPDFEFSEHHSTIVTASVTDAFQAVEAADLSDSKIAAVLMAVWRIPARLFMDNVPNRGMTVHDFIPLAYEPPRELVRGLIGGVTRQAWSADDFRRYSGPGFKLAWSFWVTELGNGHCRIDTETRVHCCDLATTRWFTLYWIIIRLPSGLIRRDMLRIIKRRLKH
jgi:hypothetical protein